MNVPVELFIFLLGIIGTFIGIPLWYLITKVHKIDRELGEVVSALENLEILK
jgi:hypothetical protein